MNKQEIDFSYKSFKQQLMKDFVDMRISSDGTLILEYHHGDEIFQLINKKTNTFKLEWIDIIIKKFIEMGKFNNKIDGQKYFSFHIPILDKNKKLLYYQGYRGVRKKSIKGEEITIRKLTTPRNIYDFIYDKKLIEVIMKGLLSRKGVIISGQTGSGKSTLFISLLNYFNMVSYDSFLLDHIKGAILSDIYMPETSKILNLVEQEYTTEQISQFVADINMLFDALQIEYNNKKIESSNINNYINFILKSETLRKDKVIEKIVKTYIEGNEELKNVLNEYDNSVFMKLMKQFSLSGLKNIVTLEEPIEFVYRDKNLRFFQHSLSLHFENNHQEFINQILRDNPNVCYIAEIRNPEEIDIFLTSISLGITSMTTMHSYDSIETLMKLIDLSTKNRTEIMNIIANSFRTGINIQSYYFTSLKKYNKFVNPYIQWWDYLDFGTPGIGTMFKNYLGKNDINGLVDMLNDGQEFAGGRLGYYPKKITLFYRLMLLYEEIQNTKLNEHGFNIEEFFKEVSILIKTNDSILNNNDMRYLKKIYTLEETNRVEKFLNTIKPYLGN